MRYLLYFSSSGIAIIIPFFLLLLAYLMLSRIEDDRSLSGMRIFFNLTISFTFVGIVIFTAWVVIQRNYYMTRFLAIYTLVAMYLIINFFLFIVLNLLLLLFKFKMRSNDILLVLGAQLTANGEMDKTLIYRLKKALKIFKQSRAKGQKLHLIVSGGNSHENIASEAEKMAKFLIANGIDHHFITIEDQARTTRENLINIQELLNDCFPERGKTLIVTSYFHLLRTYLYAWRFGFDLRVVGVRTQFGHGFFAILREYLAFFVLTKELNYFFMIGLLIYGIRQVLMIFQ
ncbi:YdcF family protein [Facklamia sp. P12934]|uniref:YdcF family protein n=2 Tax=unclassified Facklamia TaxID=2622293 RepID=UPI003D172BF5